MRNILDKKKNPTFEIDLLGHYGSNILVVECKSKWLNPLWYTRRYQNYRERDLKKEAGKKMQKRMEWVRKSLEPREDFHFFRRDPITGELKKEKRPHLGYQNHSSRIYGLIVTLFEEPIQEYENIKILSIKNLAQIDSIWKRN